MIGFLFFFFGVLATLGMCGLAAWTDFRGYRIPNLVSVVIAASFVVAYGVTWMTGQNEIVFMSIKSHLGAALIVLFVTFAMFAFKIFGAGDSKMAAAVSLWLGFPGLAPFLFYMTLIGGVLAATSLILRRYKPFKNLPACWPQKAQEGSSDIPYGIAIAGGALIAFFFLGYFDFSRWAEMVSN